jgi:hypothetical protein
MAEKEKKKKKEVGEASASAPEPIAAKPATAPRSIKIPKLAKKDKSRLPRKQKKAQQKAALAGRK